MTAFYRGRQVFQQTIYCPWGLRLVGTAEAVNMALPGQPVALPDPSEALSDYSVTRYVRQVLGSLGGGLTLWRLGSQLCAQRLGHCHTYWAVGEELFPNSGQGPSGEVPKDREGSVFDLESFVKGEWGSCGALGLGRKGQHSELDIVQSTRGLGLSPLKTCQSRCEAPGPEHAIG